MAANDRGMVAKDWGRLFHKGTIAGLEESSLLARFVAERDETAFEAIVDRHGAMVLGVCRRVLDDPATWKTRFKRHFWFLVRKANSIREGNLLGPWLFGTAVRVAKGSRGDAETPVARASARRIG